MYKNVKTKRSSSEALESFVKEFSKMTNIPFDEFDNGYNERVSETLIYQKNNKFKKFKENRFGEFYKYENDIYKLKFCALNENLVELYWIEVYNNNKGIGTKLMNDILDAADEVNVEIKLIPIPLYSFNDDLESKIRLRNWYKSFGFRSKSTLTPAMYYSPNK
jgi:hypothetical protein